MTTSVFTTVDALRSAVAQSITCDAHELQEAIGQIVVTTAASAPGSGDLRSAERSVFDAEARVMVFFADRIPAGLEAHAIAGEVLRHHGRNVAERVTGKAMERAPLVAGDKVFVLSEQHLATVLNVYGDGLKGCTGDVRVDWCGNTPIDNLEPYDPALHALYDDTFVPIKAAWKEAYGITKDVPLRLQDGELGIPTDVERLIRVRLQDSEGNFEEVDFNAADVLRHNNEARSWAQVGRDETHQHAQMSLAEDYALYAFKRKFGDMDAYEVTVLEGLDDQDKDLGGEPLSPLVDASQFHSMRGHVAEGTRVRFGSGEVLTVRSAMRGWNLESGDGRVNLGPFDGAMALTSAIVCRDSALGQVQERNVSPDPF